jgi:predicted secreted protein
MTPSQRKPELPQTAAAVPLTVTDTSPAANDDSIPTVENDLRNPLWIIAFGMAWFFGMTAAVMAFS